MLSSLETLNVNEEIQLDVSTLLRKRYLLHTRKQVEGEYFEDYYKELQCLFKLCEFKDDSILRDHVVFGIKDSSIREQLLEHDNPSLENVVVICLSGENESCTNEIDRVKRKKDVQLLSAEFVRAETHQIKAEDEDSSQELGDHDCDSSSFTEMPEPKLEPADDDKLPSLGVTALHQDVGMCDADLVDPLALTDTNDASDTTFVKDETNSITRETTDAAGIERRKLVYKGHHILKDHDYMSTTFTEPRPGVCDTSAEVTADTNMCQTQMDTDMRTAGVQQESTSKFESHLKLSSVKKEIKTKTSKNTPKIITMCKICKKVFSEQALRVHMLSHKPSDVYRTPQHPKQISQRNVPLVTTLDSGAASVQPESHWLPDDLILTYTEDPLDADICAVSKNKLYNTSAERLYSPTLNQARENPHVCFICSREYVQAKRLRAHMIFRHNDDKPYRCLYCNMTFKYRLMLNFHTRMHHKQISGRVQDLQTELLDLQNESVLDHNPHALENGAASVQPDSRGFPDELVSTESHWLPDDLI